MNFNEQQVAVSSYFYPINSAICIEDSGDFLVVMNDRPQSGSAW